VAVVRQDPVEPKRQLSGMRWGLIPFWAKDPSIGYKMINARAETVAEKPAFREALKQRRCLIPADGFYEWKKGNSPTLSPTAGDKGGAPKTPFCFTMADDSVFAFAGLWEQWKSPEGKMVETCTIITTTPNALLADVHDRMPAILPGDAYELWLDPGFQKADAVCELLKPFDARLMRRYEVSTRVNSPKYDDAACAASVVRASSAGA
jgi:putative SOS response-associated peptidase YedK